MGVPLLLFLLRRVSIRSRGSGTLVASSSPPPSSLSMSTVWIHGSPMIPRVMCSMCPSLSCFPRHYVPLNVPHAWKVGARRRDPRAFYFRHDTAAAMTITTTSATTTTTIRVLNRAQNRISNMRERSTSDASLQTRALSRPTVADSDGPS